jgi:hypothetical protein
VGRRLFSRLHPRCTQLIFGLNLCAPQLTVIGVLVAGCLFLSVAAGAQASPSLPNIGRRI